MMRTDSADPTNLRRAASHAAALGLPSAPLWLAAAGARIDLLVVTNPKSNWPQHGMQQHRRPTIVLLSGDPGDGEPTYDPAFWRCAKPLRQWASSAIVHGSGGEVQHYHLALMTAALSGRLALIETTSALAKPWHRFLAPIPTLCILPPDGGVHPTRQRAKH